MPGPPAGFSSEERPADRQRKPLVSDLLSRLDILLNPTVLGQVVVNGISLSAIYILVALGFTLLFGIMRVVNFAHGEFAMLGAFAFYHLTKDLNWPWMVALPGAVVGVATASLVLEWLVFRWFYQRMF